GHLARSRGQNWNDLWRARPLALRTPPMRVLVVAPHDWAGSLYGLCRALRVHGASIRLMTLHAMPPPPHGPPADVCRLPDGGHELRELLQRADVLHLVDLVPRDLPLVDQLAKRHPAPRFLFHWTGSAPARGDQLSQLAQQTGAPLLSERPGLSHATFVPP